ncbi:hypothetical protein [Inquilinus limosus]|uniref:Uncharacterized protein n=1 Tax=Inquilinus limosus TaxID=171674 RepID=A0A211ZMQ1_9PROT|nr:hypothetical protein [Inquilinus limosus]OWJ66444.1 hypothetical protein BWR60_14810 [Inquilinus limosus]
MDMAPSASDPALAEPTDPDRERSERHARMLARLGELALGLAEAVQGQAVESTRQAPEEAADRTRGLGLVFARLSYEVRQTVALEARLAADDRAAAAERAAAAAQDCWRRRRNLVKRLVFEAVSDVNVNERNPDLVFHREDMLLELDDRLEDDGFKQDIGDLPIGEVVARFCRGLRVEPDWSLWQAEPWAIEEAGHPLSPYARPEAAPATPKHPRPPVAEPMPDQPPPRPPPRPPKPDSS